MPACLLPLPGRAVSNLFPSITPSFLKQEFLIVRFLEPILILAKEQAPGKYMLIDEEEEQVMSKASWDG